MLQRLLVFFSYHGSVNSRTNSMLKSYRRLIERNRQLNEKIQNFAVLIRANHEVIVGLENQIKKLKMENEIYQLNALENGDDVTNSMDFSKRSPMASIAKFCFWTIFFSHTLIPLFKK